MAPIKRRAAEEPASASKGQRNAGEPASKRPRKSFSSAGEGNKSSKDADEKPRRKPTTTSVIQNEEKSFPRGGGGVLTPLEKKQIQNEATQDVLFEQQTGEKKPTKETYDYEDGEEASVSQKDTKVAKRRKSVAKSKKQEQADDASVIKIESLSFRVSKKTISLVSY